MTGSESSHVNFIGFILLAIAVYFFVAAFYPRIRMRWGVRYTKTLFPRNRASTITLKPHMGLVTCLGNAIFIGSFSLPMIGVHIAGDVILQTCFTGFGLLAVGAVLDSIREPTMTLKKKPKKVKR